MPNPCVAARSPEIRLLGIFFIVTDKKNANSDVQVIIQKKNTIKYKHEWQQVIWTTLLTTETLFRI